MFKDMGKLVFLKLEKVLDVYFVVGDDGVIIIVGYCYYWLKF